MACTVCTQPVPQEEQVAMDGGGICHRNCRRCTYCKTALEPGNFASLKGAPYCKRDFEDLFELFDINAEVEDGYDDDEEEEEDTKRKEQKVKLDPLYILLTKSRKAAIETAKDFALLEQPEESAWFNTMSGDTLISGIPGEIRDAQGKPSGREQFDALFSLTYALKRYPYWIWDNSVWEKGDLLEKALMQLGVAWYEMLQRSDDELGIDPEVTRPGAIGLLQQFHNMAQEQESGPYRFPWNGDEPQGRGKLEARGGERNTEDTGHHAKMLKVDG